MPFQAWLAWPAPGQRRKQKEHEPILTLHRAPADFLFERRLNDHIFQVIADHSSSKPALVFCSSRRGTIETATHLAKTAAAAAAAGAGGGAGARGWRRSSAYVRDAAQMQRLQQAAAGLRDRDLVQCVEQGVGYHHAALEPSDRAALEALFVAQDLPVSKPQIPAVSEQSTVQKALSRATGCFPQCCIAC